jgi:curved DNA-binding protein CbpA
MTDYFAVLEQPRAPWLDLAALKEMFHRKTLEQHPDSSQGNEGDFAKLNAAFQILQDPKRRLHHLLSLENRAPSANQPPPLELEELFLEIGTLNQQATQLFGKMRMASSPLSKSLLTTELVAEQQNVARLRDRVRELQDAADERLRQMDSTQIDELVLLYQRFAYLGRWSAQLDELAFQLSS